MAFDTGDAKDADLYGRVAALEQSLQAVQATMQRLETNSPIARRAAEAASFDGAETLHTGATSGNGSARSDDLTEVLGTFHKLNGRLQVTATIQPVQASKINTKDGQDLLVRLGDHCAAIATTLESLFAQLQPPGSTASKTLPADRVAPEDWHARVRRIATQGLTRRQREIMELVLAGYASKNISATLGISQRTVENHRAAIKRKTGSKSLAETIRTVLLHQSRPE